MTYMCHMCGDNGVLCCKSTNFFNIKILNYLEISTPRKKIPLGLYGYYFLCTFIYRNLDSSTYFTLSVFANGVSPVLNMYLHSSADLYCKYLSK